MTKTSDYILNFLLLALLFLLPSSFVSGQITIKGRVSEPGNKAVANISVMVFPLGKNYIVAFTSTDDKGFYSMELVAPGDSLEVEFSSMNHERKRIRLSSKSRELNMELKPQVMELKEVIVRTTPAKRYGDTISYVVDAFASEQDRSIADVLKKMPGVEVTSDGSILYQGDQINKFYVEDMDLMGDRYSVVSKNLPHKSVASVQIMENHQPIKLLEDKGVSQKAAMNIKLKNSVAHTGTAQIVAGATPALWDINISPMLFTKNYQIVGSYQANNMGRDVSEAFTPLTSDYHTRLSESMNYRPTLLNEKSFSPPDFSKNRYLFNNAHLLNLNNLIKLKNETQLRANIFYLNDYQSRDAGVSQTYYLPGDTIEVSDFISNRMNQNALLADFTFTRNIKNQFLENRIDLSSYWEETKGLIQNDSIFRKQGLKNNWHNIANQFRIIIPIGKALANLTSYINYGELPQSLSLTPSVFGDIISPDYPITSSRQDALVQRFNSHHFSSLTMGYRKWKATPVIGFKQQSYRLGSILSSENESSENNTGNAFSNDYKGTMFKSYINTSIVYDNQPLRMFFDFPISLVNYRVSDKIHHKSEKLDKVVFEPRLSISYEITGRLKISSGYSKSQSFGELDDIHYGYLLMNPQLLQIHDARISQSKRQNFTGYLNFKDPVNAFNSTFSYMYSTMENNQLLNTKVKPDGSYIIESIELPNTSYQHTISSLLSLYISPIKTTITTKGALSVSDRQYYLDNQLYGSRTQTLFISPKAFINASKWFNIEYEMSGNWHQIKREGVDISKLNNTKHYLKLNVFPIKKHYLGINTEYYLNDKIENYFVDLKYRYSLSKRKLDFELNWYNVFNNKSYDVVYAGAYYLSHTTYQLRPSQISLSVKFSY